MIIVRVLSKLMLIIQVPGSITGDRNKVIISDPKVLCPEVTLGPALVQKIAKKMDSIR